MCVETGTELRKRSYLVGGVMGGIFALFMLVGAIFLLRYHMRTNAPEAFNKQLAALMNDGLENGSAAWLAGRRSSKNKFGGWPELAQSDLILNGTEAHQLYSQTTFPYYNLYLGLVMVFDTADPATVGTIECRLAWSGYRPASVWSIFTAHH